jgi:hypothetical protein
MLARSAVVVVRLNKDRYEVRVKGTRALIGWLCKSTNRCTSYGYCVAGNEQDWQYGFPTQGAAVLRMLTKV